MRARNQRRFGGFTMTELMVVMASTSLLMAELLPAVQQAREAARRAQCKNNLKQIGLALHNYKNVYRTFPPGWVQHHSYAVSRPGFGWQTSILPYVGQASLYNKLFTTRNQMMPPAANATLQHVIPAYRCPSDSTEKINSMRSNYGTSNYSGNHGNVSLPRWAPGPLSRFWPGGVDTPRTTNGIFFWNSVIRIRDFTDGTSNTFLVGERCVTSAAGIWPGVTSNRSENDQVTDCSPGNEINSSMAAFSSLHPGGAHFLLGDGAVRFVNQHIESKPGEGAAMGTYQRLSARNDGQRLTEF